MLQNFVKFHQFHINKMQSETADFAPGAATWRPRNIRVVLWPIQSIILNNDVVDKIGST